MHDHDAHSRRIWQGLLRLAPLGLCLAILCGALFWWLTGNMAVSGCAFLAPLAVLVVLAIKL